MTERRSPNYCHFCQENLISLECPRPKGTGKCYVKYGVGCSWKSTCDWGEGCDDGCREQAVIVEKGISYCLEHTQLDMLTFRGKLQLHKLRKEREDAER